jgi:peptidoglycan hydrolase CwlO-like protein
MDRKTALITATAAIALAASLAGNFVQHRENAGLHGSIDAKNHLISDYIKNTQALEKQLANIQAQVPLSDTDPSQEESIRAILRQKQKPVAGPG